MTHWPPLLPAPARTLQAGGRAERSTARAGALLLTRRGVLSLAVLPAIAAAQGAGGIYSCVDERGRRITSDRPIPECNTREQRVLNQDGSLKAVRPPAMSAEERAELEARERKAAEARAAQADAARRDRNLMQRYKTEATHQRAREAALDSVRVAQRITQNRLVDLQRERKPLLDEQEFYKGKPLPVRLKNQLDANDAALLAQRDAAAGQQTEIERINRIYDIELERLRRLWAGATPGSLGPLQAPRPPQAAASAASAGTAALKP
ncbi:MAG: DUF4124 domain-containing protein [Rubrivivax sp.]|nr:DUF4124 domain-containing protein [Rubrivivax sp.]